MNRVFLIAALLLAGCAERQPEPAVSITDRQEGCECRQEGCECGTIETIVTSGPSTESVLAEAMKTLHETERVLAKCDAQLAETTRRLVGTQNFAAHSCNTSWAETSKLRDAIDLAIDALDAGNAAEALAILKPHDSGTRVSDSLPTIYTTVDIEPGITPPGAEK